MDFNKIIIIITKNILVKNWIKVESVITSLANLSIKIHVNSFWTQLCSIY